MQSFLNFSYADIVVATVLVASGSTAPAIATEAPNAFPTFVRSQQNGVVIRAGDSGSTAPSAIAVHAVSAGLQLRMVHCDLDPVIGDGDDALQVLRNIDMLVNRIRALAALEVDLVVVLSAFSNLDPTQTAYDKVFFPSSQLAERGGSLRFDDPELPRGQLFARAARAIKRSAPNVRVYAWMPTLNFRLDRKAHHYAISKNSYVRSDLPQEQNDSTQYQRLSPFVGVVWDIVGEIYRDLGKATGQYIDGIVFHDDAVITDHEDVSPKAQAFLKNADWSALVPGDHRSWDQLDGAAQAIRKSRYLDQFTLHMVAQAQSAMNQQFGLDKTLGTARHVYSSAFSNPQAFRWLGQEPASLLQDYDFLLVEAYPYMEARSVPGDAQAGVTWCELEARKDCVTYSTTAYFDTLFDAVSAQPGGLDKVVFVMQTVDWNLRSGAVTDIAPDLIGQQMRALYQRGTVHFGWYPDRYFQTDMHPQIVGEFDTILRQRR